MLTQRVELFGVRAEMSEPTAMNTLMKEAINSAKYERKDGGEKHRRKWTTRRLLDDAINCCRGNLYLLQLIKY